MTFVSGRLAGAFIRLWHLLGAAKLLHLAVDAESACCAAPNESVCAAISVSAQMPVEGAGCAINEFPVFGKRDIKIY